MGNAVAHLTVVSSGASGGVTSEEANNGLLTRQVVAGIGMLG